MATRHPKSMQQIAILIIAFSANVSGIRNEANASVAAAPAAAAATSPNKNVAYSGIGAATQQRSLKSSKFFPSQPETGGEARQSNGFQPMHVIDFTPADAQGLQHYPPSYLDANYYATTNAIQGYPTKKYARDKQFSFPNDDAQQYVQQQQPQPQPQHFYSTPATTNYNYNNNYNNKYHNNYEKQPANQEQSTPILTYLDPYTNAAAAADLQEYTVQSSLIVGSNQNYKYPFRPQKQQQQQKQHHQATSSSDYNLRPGYVFDEQIGAPATATATSTVANNHRPTHQQVANVLPQYQREESTRPLPAATTTTTKSGTKISYDSHDYPPPSYSQQQTSNFLQVPQRQDAERPRPRPRPTPPLPPASQPNYANNIDNYMQQQQQQQQHYYRPQAHSQSQYYPHKAPNPPPPPPPHYNNEFVYRPLGGRPTAPAHPSYNDYYEYQLGEIPPNGRPQQPAGATTGLASLASLFTTNQQQYAPQFASNPIGSILGAFAATAAQPATSSYTHNGAYAGGGGNGNVAGIRPLNTQLIRALENIARNDDLQCVPKVLCQMIAGQTQRGQLPSFITSPALTNFLSGFPVASPALIYGRAALLGISGGDNSCAQTYSQCPNNEYEILHYLNNHRGGFFKFFSEPEDQYPHQQTATNTASASSSLFSILAALTGNPLSTPTTTPRPRPRPTPPATAPLSSTADITSGIGNFFTNLLSEYVSGGSVEYQRRRKRNKRSPIRFNDEVANDDADDDDDGVGLGEQLSADYNEQQREAFSNSKRLLKFIGDTEDDMQTSEEDFHDEEDNEDTQPVNSFKFLNAAEEQEVNNDNDDDDVDAKDNEHQADTVVQFPDVAARILNTNLEPIKSSAHFFPDAAPAAGDGERKLKALVAAFNRLQAERKLKFPSVTDERLYVEVENQKQRLKASKALKILDSQIAEQQQLETNQLDNESESNKMLFENVDGLNDNLQYLYVQPSGKIVFPDQLNALIRKGRILSRPTYAGNYDQYVDNGSSNNNNANTFVVFDNHRMPHYQSQTALLNSHNSLIQQQQQQQQIQSNTLQSYYYQQQQQNANYAAATATNAALYHYPNQSGHNNSPPNYSNSHNHYGNGYYQRYTTTQRPYARYEDDKNVYVTNGNGVTEYYITPDGRKIYL